MPASNQDRVTIIAVREVPPHLSKEVFGAKMGALLEAFMALPVCKKNVLKWDLVCCDFAFEDSDHPYLTLCQILPMPSLFDASIRAIGFRESQRHVLAVAKYEVLADPEFARLVMEGDKEFGFCSSSSTFIADVVSKIDGPGSANPARAFWILKAPSRFSREEFSHKLGGLVDRLLAMPNSQKTSQKHSMCIQSNTDTSLRRTDALLRGLGLPVPEPMVVLMTETKSLDDAIEFGADPAVKQLAAEATAELEFHVNGVGFLGDVESKVKS
ncbi:hypothetical protein C8F04DRAFT_1195036 [Mycena alexandri]|uniref:Uncharacterized protein n=1 Tax=Mycena alexandri TaxID=1745969 RepID=A0AAD6SAE9_9AGAR|nr:hypothetical protein C8F04DRAFT_1195036 [Mycena alexandri]